MRASLPPELDALTERILGAAFAVSSILGHGFLEAVYKNAFLEELRFNNLRVAMEKPFAVHYRGKPVGKYIADLVVEDLIIVEVKTVEALARAHHAQVLNYLKASGLPIGLLLNFSKPSLEMRRILGPSVKSVSNCRAAGNQKLTFAPSWIW